MKNTRHILFLPFLLASLMLASSTMAQTTEDQRTETENATRSVDSIAAARSQYTQTVSASPSADDTTLAQLHRGGPGRPFPSQRGYPRPTYQTPWMGHDYGNAGHILVGAAIGFGIGAALGANQSARNGTPVSGGIIIGGGLFGFLGGCVGKAVGDLQGIHFASTHRRRTYRPYAPEDDEQSELRSHSKAAEDLPEAAANRAEPRLLSSPEATTEASWEEPSVPSLSKVSLKTGIP
jgi:hypothetical protein